ncbi:hypothetical protein G9A89_004244 [Geosiphon pyriformis]|nr:hypothetical protein G9A89_004244 [Geosiphon pyriformis]
MIVGLMPGCFKVFAEMTRISVGSGLPGTVVNKGIVVVGRIWAVVRKESMAVKLEFKEFSSSNIFDYLPFFHTASRVFVQYLEMRISKNFSSKILWLLILVIIILFQKLFVSSSNSSKTLNSQNPSSPIQFQNPYASSTLPITIPGITTVSVPFSRTYTASSSTTTTTLIPTESPNSPFTSFSSEEQQCKIHITSPKRGDRYAPGDEMLIKWDVSGPGCRVENETVLLIHQVDVLLFANLTMEPKQNLTEEGQGEDENEDKNLNKEWQWDYRSHDPPGTIWDVVGPFTILPIPPPPKKDNNTKMNSDEASSEVDGRDLINKNHDYGSGQIRDNKDAHKE